MNSYLRLSAFKEELNITGTTYDAALLRLFPRISRAIDNETGRIFYSYVATRYYDGDGCGELDLKRDLISVTSLATDDAGELLYDTSLDAGDYFLIPDNESPKRAIEINGLTSPVSWFPEGRKRVRITGLWGYSNETELTGATLNDDGGSVDASETAITLAAGGGLLVDEGETLVLGDEQVHVSDVSTDTLTVVRGINGTTAAAHTNGLAVYRRVYEGPIVMAASMQAARIMRDQQTGFSGAVANSEFGGFQFSSLYPAIRDALRPYRRFVFA